MFTIDQNMTYLMIKEKNMMRAFFSMNNHQVATPEMMLEEARSYIMFFQEPGGKHSAYIGLHLLQSGRRLFYAHSSNPFQTGEMESVEDEALGFVEGLGALLDAIDFTKLSSEERNRWIEQQDIFTQRPEPKASAEEKAVETAQQEASSAQREPQASPASSIAPESASQAQQPPQVQPLPPVPQQPASAPQYMPQPPQQVTLAPPMPALSQPQQVTQAPFGQQIPPMPQSPHPQQALPAAPLQYAPPVPQQAPPVQYTPQPPQQSAPPAQFVPQTPQRQTPPAAAPLQYAPPAPQQAPPVQYTPQPPQQPAAYTPQTLPVPPGQPSSETQSSPAHASQEYGNLETPTHAPEEYRPPVQKTPKQMSAQKASSGREEIMQKAIKAGIVKPPKSSSRKEAPSATGVVSRDREALARLLTSF